MPSQTVPDNDLEGHALGINFDDGNIVSLQFRQACKQTCDARDQLKSMGDVPCELSTLQACLGSCKINYLLHAAGNVISECELKNYDDLLAAGLGNILDCPISNLSSMQAACGIQSGGLGLRSAVDLALPAFIASRTDCKHYVQELICNFFNDDLGDKFMDSFNSEMDVAIQSLKNKLSVGAAVEIDVCLAESSEI